MATYTTAEVFLWGQRVGALAESDAGERVFEYDPVFRRSGLELSPIHLPLGTVGPRTFPGLARSPAFQGLPGVVADSLPDAFGRSLIREYFAQQGHGGDPTPLQQLLYVGSRGPGALTYEPSAGRRSGNEAALEVRTLVEQARRVVAGEPVEAVAEIMRVGATVGGARPKAVILWDREEGRVRSGHAHPEPGEEHWIIKFDGVTRASAGPYNRVTGEPGPWGRVEYVYSRLARRAGIEMTETHLLQDGELAHFMTRRFDRTGPAPDDRLHLHSLGGLLHLDYNVQYQTSYHEYFDTVRRLGLGQTAVNEAFRRMVFAVATVNYDDHLKNFAFLMDREGRWRLSPAYDVAYARNDAWTRQHQMSINGKFLDITRADVEAVAARYDLPGRGRELVGAVLESLDHWRSEAEAVGLGEAHIRAFEEEFARTRRALA